MLFITCKFIRNVVLFGFLCVLLIIFHDTGLKIKNKFIVQPPPSINATDDYNIWCIFTKSHGNFKLRNNFRRFITSLLTTSSVPVSLNIISDEKSIKIADDIFTDLKPLLNSTYTVQYYHVHKLADSIGDIVYTMQKYFSSQPGSYYSDALFFLSIGLHRVTNQVRAVMIDIDTEIRVDIRFLFDEFNKMKPDALFAAAPEQSPVYRHTLHMYRAANRESKFGNPISYGGNPGLNSGVLLLNLEKQRQSKLYQKLLSQKQVAKLCAKYQFHGHLGDQDWYTLLSEEYPNLVQFLDCSWNRQLCLWWRHHGYHDVFDLFHYCPGNVKIYHGNCNTEIPSF